MEYLYEFEILVCIIYLQHLDDHERDRKQCDDAYIILPKLLKELKSISYFKNNVELLFVFELC